MHDIRKLGTQIGRLDREIRELERQAEWCERRKNHADDILSISEFCGKHKACMTGRNWAEGECGTMWEVWDKARASWLCWVATRPSVLHPEDCSKFVVLLLRELQTSWRSLLTDEVFAWCVAVREDPQLWCEPRPDFGRMLRERQLASGVSPLRIDAVEWYVLDAYRYAVLGQDWRHLRYIYERVTDAWFNKCFTSWEKGTRRLADWLRADTLPNFWR